MSEAYDEGRTAENREVPGRELTDLDASIVDDGDLEQVSGGEAEGTGESAAATCSRCGRQFTANAGTSSLCPSCYHDDLIREAERKSFVRLFG